MAIMLYPDFTTHLVLLLWCILSSIGTVMALTSLMKVFWPGMAEVLVGTVVVMLGVLSLIGLTLTTPGFWWIAILPIYLGIACMRFRSGAGEPRPRFRLSTLLTLMGVTACILTGVAMQRRQFVWQRELAAEIAARKGEVQWGVDSIRGVVFFDATDSDLEALGHDLARIRGLQSLQISGLQFTDAGMQNVSRLTSLRQLYLQNTQVSDAGIQDLKSLRSLRTLDLMGTRVTDRGLSHLEMLTGLRKVWLGGSAVTAQGCESLQRALPNAEVSN
jgi:hypothetical protein